MPSNTKTRIILVDDSPVTRMVTQAYVAAAAEGAEVLLAFHGEEALGLAKACPPDLIVSDLRMPRLDGPGLCAALRLDPALAHIPVVILTSNRDTESHERCLVAGAREVCSKFELRTLIDAIRRHLPGGR